MFFFLQENDAVYIEVSAKSGENISSLLQIVSK